MKCCFTFTTPLSQAARQAGRQPTASCQLPMPGWASPPTSGSRGRRSRCLACQPHPESRQAGRSPSCPAPLQQTAAPRWPGVSPSPPRCGCLRGRKMTVATKARALRSEQAGTDPIQVLDSKSSFQTTCQRDCRHVPATTAGAALPAEETVACNPPRPPSPRAKTSTFFPSLSKR